MEIYVGNEEDIGLLWDKYDEIYKLSPSSNDDMISCYLDFVAVVLEKATEARLEFMGKASFRYLPLLIINKIISKVKTDFENFKIPLRLREDGKKLLKDLKMNSTSLENRKNTKHNFYFENEDIEGLVEIIQDLEPITKDYIRNIHISGEGFEMILDLSKEWSTTFFFIEKSRLDLVDEINSNLIYDAELISE